MSPRLADRVNAGRSRRFIGRGYELDYFREAVTAAELPFYVLFLSGPGGVGKSSLLGQFARVGREAGATVCALDARNLDPSPESFSLALAASAGFDPAQPFAETVAERGGRFLLLIDTYELLTPLDRWLREEFLPQLPEEVMTVVAGRYGPNHAWRADPGWQPLIRSVALRNLSPDEGRAYLMQRNVPGNDVAAILDFTHSYPLALSLVADLYEQRTGFTFRPETANDVVKVLVDELLQSVPGPAHRAALEACALVRVTTESLLETMIGEADAGDVFRWLRNLSFVDARPGGLFPHDLAREALVADLRWRNPDWYAELHRRARGHYLQRMERGVGPEQQLALFDLIFLHRDNPVVRPVFEWQTSGRVLPGVPTAHDVPALLAMVAEHEGSGAARVAEHWLATQPDATILFRDADGHAAGFAMFLNLSALDHADVARDPALTAAQRVLHASPALHAGERASYFRFWMAADGYQSVSPTQSLIFINMVRHYLTTPGLAFTFIPCAEPDFWTPVFAYADLVRFPDADFELDGRRYGVFGHDWRAVPPAQWLELLGEREIAMAPQAVKPPAPVDRVLVLSEDAFAAAVRDALRDLSRPGGLVENPLLRSRLVMQAQPGDVGVTARATHLRKLVEEAVDTLRMSPKEVKFYRAVYHTYVQPAPTQEAVSELLDVPFSSYRRHLKSGVDRVTEILWLRETGA